MKPQRDVKQLLHPLWYELWMLNETADRLRFASADRGMHCALLESFLVHLRCLMAFAIDRSRNLDDIRTGDFKGLAGIPEVKHSGKVVDVIIRINKQRAHITLERLDGIKPWAFEEYRRETNAMLRPFFEPIPEEHFPEDHQKDEFGRNGLCRLKPYK